MQSALVLNATYEPLSVVSSRRAICLVLGDKADLIEHDESFLRSERLSLPNPSVIRLRYVVKVPYHRRTSLSRRAVFARDDNRCQYCAGIADSLDHVMPRSRGVCIFGKMWLPPVANAILVSEIGLPMRPE